MRAGRLPEILCNEDIIVVGACGYKSRTKEFRSTWKLMDFATKFPYTEVVKISPINEDTLMVYVYNDTAKALAEQKYDDVLEYSKTLELHSFEDDLKYIESRRQNQNKKTKGENNL